MSEHIDLRDICINSIVLNLVNLEYDLGHGYIAIDSAQIGRAGLREFLKDRSISADATPQESNFRRALRFRDGRHPAAIYYYRALQDLLDPLHFRRK
jgi:hypothetical protein